MPVFIHSVPALPAKTISNSTQTLINIIASGEDIEKAAGIDHASDISWENAGIELLKNIILGILTGGIYSLYSIISSIQSIQTIDEDIRAEQQAVNGLINALIKAVSKSSDQSQKTNSVEFNFKGITYILSDPKAITGNDSALTLTIKGRTDFNYVFEGHSMQSLVKRSTLLNLFTQLNPEAQKTFLPLFQLEEVGDIDLDSPIVSGDLDGSTARQILLGMLAGIIDLKPAGVPLLARLINDESATLIRESNPRLKQTFCDFQMNIDRRTLIENLALQLTYKKGHTPLIMIGDCSHDRLSCNKDVDREIREQMHAHGAIFIVGNHDVIEKSTFHFGPAYGGYAKNTATEEEWRKHQETVFRHAYYHEPTNTLYSHNGAKRAKVSDQSSRQKTVYVIETAFDLPYPSESTKSAYYPISDNFNPKQFVNYMNQKPLPVTDGEIDRFTNFRPNKTDIKKLAAALKVRMVCGHNDYYDVSDPNALMLNSRQEKLNEFSNHQQTDYVISAVRVGKDSKLQNK